ncbi:MAG: hypothetical protein ACREUW_07685 [Burkholderiales bacterium]
MKRILLVATVHEENGLASISALHAILERIRPAVIFLEIPWTAFEDYAQGTRSNLESSAARLYRERSSVVLIPVDSPTPEESFFRDWEYMDRRIAKTNPAYRQLIDQNSRDIATYGFPYLNSERSSRAWSDIYETMDDAIERLRHDTKLSEFYELWRHTNDLRDREMLRRIDDYCLHKPFENGVFLVGAAHRQSIIMKSREGRDTGAPKIEFNDSYAP